MRPLGLAVLLAALAGAGPASADGADKPAPASPVDVGKARQLFEDATVALHAGRFADAVKALRASLAIAPRTATAFNLGVALRGTGDAVGAAAVFETLESGTFGELDAKEREQVKGLRDEVAREIATLVIDTSGAEAIDVRVDGEEVGIVRGSGRVSARVNPGSRRVVVSARDRLTEERTVEVPRGATISIRVELRPERDERPGHVVLECSDRSAMVLIDGFGEGRGRLERDLPPGEYAVRVRTSAGERRVRLNVPAGRAVKLGLDPPSVSVVQRPWFWVVVGVVVAGGVTAAVVATRPRTANPVSDPYWGVTPATHASRMGLRF
jgi:hypothetical protein